MSRSQTKRAGKEKKRKSPRVAEEEDVFFFCAKDAKMKSCPGVLYNFFSLLFFNLQSAIETEMFCPEETSKNICLLTRSLDARVAR